MRKVQSFGKVLVVEDSPSIQELIKAVLVEDGYEVYCTFTGEKAIEIVALHKPDLILLDIIMPGIDGYETCSRIKQIKDAEETPIIFMSVLGETFNKVKAFESGAVDYVIKPIDTQELLSRVHTHMTIKKLRDELKHSNMNLEDSVRRRTAQLSEANIQLKKEISDRKQAQELLKQAHGKLEKKVAERTEELKLAKEKAEAANSAKCSFVANMSHEIRTPISGIMGFTYLILNSNLSKDQREQMNYINQSCEHLLSVINDILDLSKIEAGQLELDETPFHLPTLIQTVIQTLTPKSQEKQLALTYDIEPSVPQDLIGDPTRLRQVLFNLIYNAIKFTGAGEVSVSCRKTTIQNDEVTLQFSVTDTGIGLSKNQLEHVFERFIQVDAHTKNKPGGTGLGLSISKHLIELMGGRIWVDSKQGQGSSFNFKVKCSISRGKMRTVTGPCFAGAISTGDTDGHQIGRLKDKNANSVNGQDKAANKLYNCSLKILLVEDNEINMKMAANLLEKMGQKVTTAENGAEAVNRVKRQQFDIVFMDIQMPIMDGIEATRSIRNWEVDRGSPIPIIAMTAHAMQGDCEKFLEAGMSDYLSKPIDPKILMEKLVAWYQKIRSPEKGDLKACS